MRLNLIHYQAISCQRIGSAHLVSYNRAMADTGKPPAPLPAAPVRRPAPACEKVLCERCGAEMFRMHAVWRCPECRFKTDCCGW